MFTHGNDYIISQMSPEMRRTIKRILSYKPDYTQLKKDVAEYYKLREISDKKLCKKK